MAIVIRIETDNANALYYVLRQIGYKAIYGGIQSIAGDYPGYVLAPNYTVGTVTFEQEVAQDAATFEDSRAVGDEIGSNGGEPTIPYDTAQAKVAR